MKVKEDYRKFDTILEIKWLDASGDTGWRYTTEIDELVKDEDYRNISSIGYYIGTNRDCIVLGQTIDHVDKNSLDNYIKIPKQCIISIKVIRR